MSYVYSIDVVTQPAVEPITLEEARLHCKVDSDNTADDELIRTLIQAARESCENETGRAFVRQVFDMRIDTAISWLGGWDTFGQWIALPRQPIISIDSFNYIDSAGDEQVLDADQYTADIYTGRIYAGLGITWPAFSALSNGIRIRFTAGYPGGSPASDDGRNVPAVVKIAMKFLIGTWYRNRETVAIGHIVQDIPDNTVKHLLAPLKINWL